MRSAMRPTIKPPALQRGDLIAVAALSSGLERDSLPALQRATRELEDMGFRVRPSRLTNVDRGWWWAAARPAEVGEQVNELFRDPEVRAIWELTGGRFALSYLDSLDYDAIAANPKPFLGMSDITVANLAIHSRTGLATISADELLAGVGSWEDLPEPGRTAQRTAYRRVLTSTDPIGALPALSTWETWREGRAEGPLLGGMLNRLIKVQASPYALAPDRFDGAILFLEEYNAPTINVWHDLQILRLAGVFDRIAGLVIGPVGVVEVADYAPQSYREVVLDVVGERDIPILANVNCGHADPNLPLPLGIRAALDAGSRTIELVEGAVT